MRATVAASGGKLEPLPDYQPTVELEAPFDPVTDEAVRAGTTALARSMSRGAGMTVRRVTAEGSGEGSA